MIENQTHRGVAGCSEEAGRAVAHVFAGGQCACTVQAASAGQGAVRVPGLGAQRTAPAGRALAPVRGQRAGAVHAAHPFLALGALGAEPAGGATAAPARRHALAMRQAVRAALGPSAVRAGPTRGAGSAAP